MKHKFLVADLDDLRLGEAEADASRAASASRKG